MEKFTIGPWTAQSGSVYKSNTGMYIAHTDMNSTGDDERNANAALIAAAPEMYEMLKSIRLLAEYGYSHSETGFELISMMSELNALLAKARGEK